MATRKRKTAARLSPVARETRASRSEQVTEEDVKAAFAIINRDYWQDVHSVGDDLKEQIERGEITDGDQFLERLSEAVDGSARVIYTFQAKLGLLCTNNPDAYEDVDPDMKLDWSKMMFFAMEQDVSSYVGAVDFDD